MHHEILAFSRSATTGLLTMAPLAVIAAVMTWAWLRGRRLP
jgi:hypothetical protein